MPCVAELRLGLGFEVCEVLGEVSGSEHMCYAASMHVSELHA